MNPRFLMANIRPPSPLKIVISLSFEIGRLAWAFFCQLSSTYRRGNISYLMSYKDCNQSVSFAIGRLAWAFFCQLSSHYGRGNISYLVSYKDLKKVISLSFEMCENVLLQKHLLKQCHHKQILRFRYHLVRTLLLLCCHLIQTLCWQRYQGQVPLPGYNRHISICHIFEACKPLTKLREQRTLHCSLTIPLQHLSVTSIESLCKSFFSNSPTKQLLLLLLLGLKHDVLTLKGNFAKQAELISSLIDA